MKIRPILATAVAAAVTMPALLLSVSPAFADDKPAAQTQDKTQDKPSIAELEKAAAAAKAAYDDAVKAESAAKAALEAAQSDTSPLAVAAKAAKTAAAEAAAAKVDADQAVIDAQAAVDALPETATEEEKAAAATELTEAKTAAETAKETKAAADAAAVEAVDAWDDELVAAARKLGQAQKATKEALADKTAADEALAKAKEEGGEDGEDCVPEARLTTVVTGLPSTVVAGTKVDFKLRVTNGTDKTMDKVLPFAYVHATDRSGLKSTDDLVHLQWSSASSSKWKTVDNKHYMDAISPLKAGAHADIKMRLKVDASAPAGNGVTFVAGDYFNDNGTCGGNPDLEGYEFLIAAAGSRPGKVDDAKPSTTKPNTSDVKTQSSASRPVSGSLAATGSSSAMPQLALASGAAMAIGGGAVFLVRRRKAGTHA
ncbi:LPXTG cell wall anchor domain-containing protein [Streptomyces sp. NBC_00053]|uniref:LAETG motif-containing sortase-dependent surface protein n=1 Tax=unclassified Streptomyces TaxID=2593676 RepID=UPI0022561F6C|nr:MULTISPECIES: LAETG motif-containing sortase-dependent surface protein [unclassified Streptomyces]WSG51782.1 LPXTG cell wall anchor domain-containing protein [Streptomyces sp. NBC_01732]MCX4395650.1 LPXTG cell wall anchor domain-containing protein [Streptomyces sp. NBC_01767]MCX5101719.1 LPXTG cell wall anchor domain-containing protein [Streptomyces sp. NBC_00439]MCX5501522.1 LPXTG cell wall anchor domain-containing protein [Streptomyces sp. NBC_00052]MCX5549943.1 LPXTG cell wall anchor dom